ncbi:MAG: hypothetical protein ACYTFA_00605 [Planctomycetota bacterium]|jgi:hypothetical protein
MTKKRLQGNVVLLTTCLAISWALSGGCVPVDTAELGAFINDLLLNAAAAFLL